MSRDNRFSSEAITQTVREYAPGIAKESISLADIFVNQLSNHIRNGHG